MASIFFSLQNLSLLSSSSFSSSYFPIPQPRIHCPCNFDSLERKSHVSSRTLQPIPGEENLAPESCFEDNNKKKNKNKKKQLRPNFYDQTLRKWSVKRVSQRSAFPWQEQDKEEKTSGYHYSTATGMSLAPDNLETSAFMESLVKPISTQLDEEVGSSKPLKNNRPFRVKRLTDSVVKKMDRSSNSESSGSSSRAVVPSEISRQKSSFKTHVHSAPWAHGVESKNSCLDSAIDEKPNGPMENNSFYLARDPSLGNRSNKKVPIPSGCSISSLPSYESHQMKEVSVISSRKMVGKTKFQINADVKSLISSLSLRSSAKNPEGSGSTILGNCEDSMNDDVPDHGSASYSESDDDSILMNSLFDDGKPISSISFPWERQNAVGNVEAFQRRSNTELAERTIPEPELRRLRNDALRMKERMKIGSAGVTEAVVNSVHQKWNEAEVVKLQIEGPPSFHMKRTHEILERKTGGIVIWRSGRSLVLYRGMTYKLPCARSFSNLSDTIFGINSSTYSNNSGSFVGTEDCIMRGSEPSDAAKKLSSSDIFGVSREISVVNDLLNQLGPRYKDWSGREPLPVDADMLPTVVPGYKTPFRLLPYKTRRSLTNTQMTYLRRIARSMAPHFALGRNKYHQGLADAIVKLWEKSAIAKIAIKRGVQNTSNERMAEEIKELTGGTLLSRNSEFIVFYRGNDFLTPSLRHTLVEREKLATDQQDAEEDARSRASYLTNSYSKAATGPLVAGTLTETLEAFNHWANQPSCEEREKMRRDIALSKHASLVRYLERKLSYAIAKVRKAEKALAKLQESLQPAKIPTDLETVTDEERSLFRQLGLKMRAYLPVGRRDVFDGTIQNIHLNWKHRELAKIVVKGKSFAQVKHIAISLEAETGGVLISIDKTTKGYAIIIYRGKNYQRPHILRPKNLLSKREALERSIELQRREALNHHISNLHDQIHMLKSQLAQKEVGGETGHEELHVEEIDDALLSDYDVEDEGEEAYLETYSGDEGEDDD